MNWFYKFLDKVLGSNTLYYPWCLTKSVLPDVQQNYEKLLSKLWIDFIKLSDIEFCCGSPVVRAWLQKDFEDIKKQNIEVFQKHAVNLIITNCPACYNMLKYNYDLEKYWIKVEHITQTVHRKQNKLKPKTKKEFITYHDPCHLWRHSWVYEQPRQTLTSKWYQVKEMKNNRELSTCCGGGWWLINNNPELSEKIASQSLSQANKGKIVSPCPMCYYQFKKNTKDHEVKEYSTLMMEE